MPPLEEIEGDEPAVLWAKSGEDANGEPVVGDPRQVWCQWAWKQRQVLGPNGAPTAVDATVSDLAQGIDVPLGSLFWQGSLEDFSAADAPFVMEVISIDQAMDLKQRFTAVNYGLAFFRRAPSVVKKLV